MSAAALASAARRLADQQAAKITAASGGGQVIATVVAVTAGAASDGNALVQVTFRGQAVTVSGYADTYTPAVGHRVVCAYIDNQLVVQHRIIGHP